MNSVCRRPSVGSKLCAKMISELCALCERKNLPCESHRPYLIEWVRTFSHRFTQMNRTHRGQKDSGPSPFPSWPLPRPLPPKGRGVITEIPLWAGCRLLFASLLVSSLAVTFCEFCMPKAFYGLETVRKKALLNL